MTGHALLKRQSSKGCQSCINYYLSQAKKAGIREGKVSGVLAKVMVVSANQKRFHAEETLNRYKAGSGFHDGIDA